MIRRRSDPTFFDAQLADMGSSRRKAFYVRIDQLVDWNRMGRLIQGIFKDNPLAPGQPHEHPVMIAKVTMLQRWFNLSDPELQEHCNDSIATRKWLGLFGEEPSPDKTTFEDWRRRLREGGHEQTIFNEVTRILQAHELLVNQGTLVDATLILAPRPKKKKLEKQGKALDDPKTPPSRNENERTFGGDPEAAIRRQGFSARYGYLASIATDRRGFVIGTAFTPGDVHESQKIDELIKAEKIAVFADSAYFSKKRTNELAGKNIFNGICDKPMRAHPLTKKQKIRNYKIKRIRSFVEHPFAWVKNTGYRVARYLGVKRNHFDWHLRMAACNLKRALSYV